MELGLDDLLHASTKNPEHREKSPAIVLVCLCVGFYLSVYMW